MQQLLGEILAKRRDRAIAIVLGVKERECDQHLPPEASHKLRKVVLDQLNDYHDLCVDVMRSLDTGDMQLNAHYMDKLDSIHQLVYEMAKQDA